MLNEYPILFVSSLDGTIIDYDVKPIGRTPELYPGMEMSLGKQGFRWEVNRVFLTQTSHTEPCLFVEISPATKYNFVLPQHVSAIKAIYEHMANRALNEEEVQLAEEEDDEVFPWSDFYSEN